MRREQIDVLNQGKPIERWGRKVSGLPGESPTIAGLLRTLNRFSLRISVGARFFLSQYPHQTGNSRARFEMDELDPMFSTSVLTMGMKS